MSVDIPTLQREIRERESVEVIELEQARPWRVELLGGPLHGAQIEPWPPSLYYEVAGLGRYRLEPYWSRRGVMIARWEGVE